MALLHYQNLVRRPDILMKSVFFGLKTFYDFLRRTKDYMESDAAVKRLAWKPGVPPDDDDSERVRGFWVQLEEPRDRPNEPESTFRAFMDENVRDVFDLVDDEPDDPTERRRNGRRKFADDRKLLVLDRDLETSQLLADLFDRLSHLSVTVPPLRECRDDLKEDWGRVWRELRQQEDLPAEAPWSQELDRTLRRSALSGNLRDLQRLAALCMAWWTSRDPNAGILMALAEWEHFSALAVPITGEYGEGSRTDRIHWFRARLAQWAKAQHGTWAAAATALFCDEKTLRQDAALVDDVDE